MIGVCGQKIITHSTNGNEFQFVWLVNNLINVVSVFLFYWFAYDIDLILE